MDVDSLLKSSPESLIKFPGSIGGSHHKNTFLTVSATIHLDEELSLNSSRTFVFSLGSFSAEGIYFIDEDHGGLSLTGKLEELFDEALGLSLPLAY